MPEQNGIREKWQRIIGNLEARLAEAIFVGPDEKVPVARIENVNTVEKPLPGIYVRLEENAGVEVKEVNHRGFSIELVRGTFTRSDEEAQFALIRCNESAFNELFILFSEALVKRLQQKIVPSKAIIQSVNEWMIFFKKSGIGPLELEELTGLFAELTLFQELCKIKKPGKWLIECWQGPRGGTWDFSIAGNGRNSLVEVKTTIRPKTTVTVNGMDQLSALQRFDCYLNFRTLEYAEVQKPQAEGTIVHLIESIQRSLHDTEDGNLVPNFNEQLELVGFYPHHSTHYAKRVFRLAASKWHNVKEDFPSLSRHRLPPDVRDRIERLTYRLNLAGLPECSSPFA